MTRTPSNILPWHCGLAAAFLAFTAYLLTLCPTVYAGDSGELTLAAWSLGIAHPPGYPLFVLLGHFFVRTGELFGAAPAAMTNLLSAVFSALAVFGVAALLRRFGVRAGVAVAGALALAFSVTFWRHAVVTEVYALNAAMFAVLLVAVERIERHTNPRALPLVAYLAGLSLVVHQSFVLMLPFIAVAMWRRTRPRALGMAAICFATGVTLYLFLPLRSLSNPAIDWGDPENLTRWVAILLRRNYGALAQTDFSAMNFLHHTAGFFADLAAQYSVMLLVLAVPGIRHMHARRPRLNAVLIGAGIVYPLGIIALLRPPVDSVHAYQLSQFSAVPAMAFAVWIASGLSAITATLGPRLRWAPAAVAATIPIWLFAQNLPANNLRDFFDARVYGENLLRAMPDGATLITDGDNESFIVAYLHQVEGMRPDVALVQRKGYLFDAPASVRHARRDQLEGLAAAWLDTLIAARTNVFAATDIASAHIGGATLHREGLVFRVGGHPVRSRSLRAADLSVLDRDPVRLEFIARKFAIGYLEAASEDPSQTSLSYDHIVAGIDRFGHDFAEAQYVVGVERERRGDTVGAWRAYRRATRLDPAAAFAREGLDRLSAQLVLAR